MGRRTLLLVAAVLLAAIGTGVLFVYFKATTPVVSGSKTDVNVFAPRTAILAGTELTETMFVQVPVSKTMADASGMIRRVVDFKGQLAARNLSPYDPLVPADVGEVVTQDSDLRIPSGKMAMAIDVDDAARVSTFLKKGSHVTVYMTTEGGNSGNEARVVLQNVTVLTIGSAATITRPGATPTAGSSRGSASLVTLLVDQDEAGKLLVAQSAGTLYLTLLGPDTTPTKRSYGDADIGVSAG